MKKVLIALFLIHGIIQAQTPCPRWGVAKEGTLVYALNMKKNRPDIPQEYQKIAIRDFLKLPDDSTGDGTAYELTGGFVISVKKQGPESCNCKSTTDRDFHIVVVPEQKYSDSVSMYVIVEVTPGIKKMMNWTDKDIFNLKNKRVDFFGWKFADLEHKNMSLKSNPTRKTCWRGTINELHPVIKFVIYPDGS
jgi:hypothetical protein